MSYKSGDNRYPSKKLAEVHRVERPREKMVKYGANRLTNSELISVLLGSGTKKKGILELSQDISKVFDEHSAVSFELIKQIDGIGFAKACSLLAAIELGKRLSQKHKLDPIKSVQDIIGRVNWLRSKPKEHLVAFFLTPQNFEISNEIISIGTLTSTLVHPREVFERA